jgi:hypothetical protein
MPAQTPSMDVKLYTVRNIGDGPAIRLPDGIKGKYRVIVNANNGIITCVPEKLYASQCPDDFSTEDLDVDETIARAKFASIEDLFE